MASLRKLASASLIATFILISIGGLVRATKSGLGCGTDWPHCAGRLVPALESRAEIIEFSHRAAASVVVFLLAALLVLAWRRRDEDPRTLRASMLAFGGVLFQAVLGAVVVKLELEAQSVVLHLGTALALLSVLVYLRVHLAAHSGGLVEPADANASRRAMVAAGGVLVLVLIGSYIGGISAERNAGFPDWPLVDGRLIPDLGVEILALHWIHRVLALVAGVLVIRAVLPAIRSRATAPLRAKLAHVAAGAYLLEVLVGATNVWTQADQGLNSASITLHLALGALIWGSLVAMAAVAAPGLRTASTTAPAGHAALEAGAG
ncbi:MAG TPA: COX15/CtaA family protein [Actinomycetota bacterium]|nr:COX15/CtaA family protein [Actinomycetota bacterium]